MEKSLGKAYAEPAADVRGYIAYVKSQKNNSSGGPSGPGFQSIFPPAAHVLSR